MPGNLSKKTLHRLFSILFLLVLSISSLGMGSYSVVQAQEGTGSTPTAISTQTPTGTPSPPDRALSSPHISDELIVRFSPGIAGRQREGILQGASAQVRREIPALQVFVLRVPPERLEHVLTALSHNPNLEFVEPNYIATAVDGEPSDPLFPEQWGLEAIGAPDAWSVTTGAEDVVIAVVDTGVDLTHPDLDDKIVTGWDFVNDDTEAQDDHGHGTHVAGIAAAESDNGIGVAGVSWGARIMPVKVLDASASGSYADVAAGIVYAVDNGAQVINLSLGGIAPSLTLQSAIEYAYEGGVVVVAAAGNTGSEGLMYPAAYPEVIAVGAVDQNLERASFSSYGPELDLVAPGVDILSTCLGGAYCSMSGTSMAAPYVTGTSALLVGIHGESIPDEVSDSLVDFALDLGEQGIDLQFGYGMVHAEGIFKAIGPTPTPTKTLEPTPTLGSVSGHLHLTARIEEDNSIVYLVDEITGQQEKITEEPIDSLWLPMFQKFLTISPNNQYVTYVTADSLGMFNARLWLVDLEANSRRVLATFPHGFWIAPLEWSPDSTRISFTKAVEPSQANGRIELWVIDVETGEQNLFVSASSFRSELFLISDLPVVSWLDEETIQYTDYITEQGSKVEYKVNLSSGLIQTSRSLLESSEQSLISILASLPCNVTQFSQNNPEWSGMTMYTCNEFIGDQGCALTSTAMVFNYYGVDTNPKWLNLCLGNNACPLDWIEAANGCSSGNVSWQGLPGFSWSTLESELQAARPPILDLYNGAWHHFVVVIAGSGTNIEDYNIIDPWDGQLKSLSSYAQWSRETLRLYSGTPWCNGDTPPSEDTTPPTGYFTNPSDGATITSRTVTISVNASDNVGGSGVKEVRFSAAWDGAWHGIGTDSSEPYSIDWDLCSANVPDGANIELGMEIWDNADNKFVWSEHGDNPFISMSYNCAGDGGDDPIPAGAWGVEWWQNQYLAGWANWSGTVIWDDGNYPYIYYNWGSSGPVDGWGGDEFSGRLIRNVDFPGGSYIFYTDHDDGVRVYVDGQIVVEAWWDGHGEHANGRYISPGTHEVKVEYYENLGDAFLHVYWYGPGYERPDTQAPNGSIISPEHLSGTSQSPLLISAEATDDSSGVQKVDFSVWHCVPTCDWHYLGTDTSSPYEYYWDWSALPDMHIWLKIDITDNSGKINYDAGGWVEVDLDRSVPSVSIDSPIDNTYLTSDLIPIQVTASDTGSGIKAVQFYAGYSDLSGASALEEIEPPSPVQDIMTLEAGGLEAEAQEYWHEVGWDTDGSDGWNITWDASAVPDQGGIAFFVYAYDNALNYDGASSWNSVLDRTPPASMVNSLPSTVGTSFTVSWQGSDNTSGIASFDVQYQLNGGAWVNWQEGVAAIEATFNGLLGDTYAFRSRARDMAGNLEDWPSSPDAQTTVSAPPANDNMSETYIVGALPYSNTQNTGGATLEVDEPTYSCGYNNAASVWYRYTTGVDGNFTIDTFGSDYDTVLHVFEDPGDGSLSLVGCNDDSDVLQSKVIFGASAGSSYLIGVTHYGGGSGGSLVLNMDEQVCPASALCVVVKDAKGAAAWYPRVVVLDGADNWVAEASGGSDGYVVIDPAPSGTYQLVTSAWELFIVDEGVSAPGIISTTAQGLPDVEIVARDSGGATIDAKVILAQNPQGYGYVGYTYANDPLIVYASPGTYDISVIGYEDRYLLSLEDQVVSTPGQTIVLDASTMPTDIVTLDWDGFPGGNFSSYAPFTNYWFGINVADGQSVTLSVPEENYRVWTEAVFDDIATGDVWQYRFSHCCFTTGTGGANTTLTVGGTFSSTAHSLSANYLPGQTGELSTTVVDAYDNNMDIIWHWDDDAVASTLESQLSSLSDSGAPAYILDENGQPREVDGASGGLPSRDLAGTDAGPPSTKFSDTSSSSDISAQGAWKNITPAYQVTDAIGAAISGSLIGNGLYADYEFTIPDPANEGVWEGQATVDFGPYQDAGTGTTNFNVITFDIPNDDFDNATPIDTMPFSISQEMWAASVAADDPTFPCTSLQHYRSVWFEYTPSMSGTLSIDTDGSGYDTVLAVWTGERGSLSNVACNDDVVIYEITHSSVQLSVWAGTKYYVEVAGYSNFSTGMLNLSATFDQVTVTKLYLPLIAAQAPGGSSQ